MNEVLTPTMDPPGAAAASATMMPSAIHPIAWQSVWFSRALWLLLPLTLGLAITNQSLWTDEGFTISFAAHRTFSSFVTSLIGTHTTPGDPQIALYLAYVWAWIKVFGQSEVALRAANVPFALIFVAAAAWGCRHVLKSPNAWALFCVSPFFWFYLNEARPYVALLAFSALATAALLAYLLEPQSHARLAPWFSLLGLLLACATHVMAIFLGVSFAVLLGITLFHDSSRRAAFLFHWRTPAFFFLPLFGLLATFIIMVSANGVNNGRGTPRLSGLAYVLYEFLGFSGLGPPRNDINVARSLSIFLPYWPWLLLGLAPLGAIAYFLFRTRPSPFIISTAVGMIIGAALPVAISFHQNFQVLGRHLAIFFPLVLFIFLLWLKPLFENRPKHTAVLAALFSLGIVWTVSDLRLISLDKYQKDSYRDAVAQSLTLSRANDAPILWAADPQTALYYGLEIMSGSRPSAIAHPDSLAQPVRGQAIDARNWTDAQISAAVAASPHAVLVLGSSYFFDMNGAWHLLASQKKPRSTIRLPGFAVYDLSAAPSSAHVEETVPR